MVLSAKLPPTTGTGVGEHEGNCIGIGISTAVMPSRVANKAMEMRRQGFVGAAMLPMAELEYTGITEKLAALEKRFVARAPAAAAVA